jgi:AP-1 complex subunit gamma-1
LDEATEILTLVTNSMKNDLRSDNQYVVGLALTAAGNIGSPEMMRNLAPEIDRRMRDRNPYIRKKAALCALRVVRKVPELAEDFYERVGALLNDRNHGVFINGVALVSRVVTDPELEDLASNFKTISIAKKMVKRLESLVRSGYQPEYDVAGITDPFLQVAILRLLRYLGENDSELSEVMSDILAQVATNTDGNKNTANAILYECVSTIMNIESESGLRVLAVNLLGRFLRNPDNNIRYVALNTLCDVVDKDVTAVNRHRQTVVECLKDPDVSIRRRAMELIRELVNRDNVRVLVREMLNYLVVEEPGERRSDLCGKIAEVVRKYAPSRKWEIETMFTMLSVGGKDVRERMVTRTIEVIARSADDERESAASRLWKMVQEEGEESEALMRVAMWCFGEIGVRISRR